MKMASPRTGEILLTFRASKRPVLREASFEQLLAYYGRHSLEIGETLVAPQEFRTLALFYREVGS